WVPVGEWQSVTPGPALRAVAPGATLLQCGRPALGAIWPEHVGYQHHRSHRYRTVGDIERGEVPALVPVHQDEVHHVAMHYAVVQVAEGAAEDQGQGD